MRFRGSCCSRWPIEDLGLCLLCFCHQVSLEVGKAETLIWQTDKTFVNFVPLRVCHHPRSWGHVLRNEVPLLIIKITPGCPLTPCIYTKPEGKKKMGCSQSDTAGKEALMKKAAASYQHPVYTHHSPKPSPRVSPVSQGRHSPKQYPKHSPRGHEAKTVNGRLHPMKIEEVAVRMSQAFSTAPSAKDAVVKEVLQLATVLGKSQEEFAHLVTEDHQYKYTDNPPDLMHFLMYHFLMPDARICKADLEEVLFQGSTKPPVSVKGGFVEGTGHEEHFVIGSATRSVVAGGSGHDVFMFLPRADRDSVVQEHIITDFDPSEDLIDLRALPIRTLEEVNLEVQGHHHCQLRGPELDVVLIGVHPNQLEKSHFIFAFEGTDVRLVGQSTEQKGVEPPFHQPSVFVFTQPGEVSSSDFSDVFVILPSNDREHIIQHFKIGGTSEDRIDLRGLQVSDFKQLKLSEYVQDDHVCTRIGMRGATICLPNVKMEDLSASHFIFPASTATACELNARSEKEPSLATNVFKSVVFWCLDTALPTETNVPVESFASPRAPVCTQSARFSPIPLATYDLDLLGVDTATNPASPTSSSVTNSTHFDWCKRVSREPEGRRIRRNIDRLVSSIMQKMFEVSYGKVHVSICDSLLFKVRPRAMPRLKFDPNVATLLPPQEPTKEPRYTIVLDLDETLVYSRHMHHTHQLCVRHGVHDLMVLLKQYNCEVVMWSAADAETVNAVWTATDPTGITSHVLPREAWQRGVYEQKKDLTRLGRDLDWVLIVDNTPLAVAGQLDNAIVVRDFLGGDHAYDVKTEMYRLMKLLKTMFMKKMKVPDFLKTCRELAEVKVWRRQQDIEFNVMHHVPLFQE